MELIRKGAIGRILAIIGLVSFWLIPVIEVGYIESKSVNGAFWLVGLVETIAKCSDHGEPTSCSRSAWAGLLQIILITTGGFLALLSGRVSRQALGGIIGFIGLIWLNAIMPARLYAGSLYTGIFSTPVYVRATLLGTVYVGMGMFLGLAILPLIARAGAQVGPLTTTITKAPTAEPAQDFLHKDDTVCPNCGSHNSATNRFCAACGTALLQQHELLTSSESEAQPPRQRLCTSCGAVIRSIDSFCRSCGARQVHD